MGRLGAILGLLTALWLAVVWSPAVLAQAPEELAFVDDEPLVVAFDEDGNSDPVRVTVRNAGAARSALEFRLLVLRDGAPVSDEFTLTATPTEIAANAVESFELTLVRVTGTEAAEGHLVVLDTGGAGAPAVRPIALEASHRLISLGNRTVRIGGLALPGGPGALLGGAALLSGLMVVGRAIAGRFRFADEIGMPEWNSKAWAGTLTVVGAAFGTFIKDFIPGEEEATFLSDAQYVGMHLLCAALVALSPLVFSVTRPHTSSRTLVGVLFLLLGFVVFTAAIAEIGTLLLGVADIASSLESPTLARSLAALAVVATASVLAYGWQALGAGFRRDGEAGALERMRARPRKDGEVARFSMF